MSLELRAVARTTDRNVNADYKPPFQLQINSATRAVAKQKYYSETTFTFLEPQTNDSNFCKWLLSLESADRSMIRSIHLDNAFCRLLGGISDEVGKLSHVCGLIFRVGLVYRNRFEGVDLDNVCRILAIKKGKHSEEVWRSYSEIVQRWRQKQFPCCCSNGRWDLY